MCQSRFISPPGDKQFVCPPGDKISHSQEREGDENFSHTGGGQTFFVGGGGGHDDVDKEMDGS